MITPIIHLIRPHQWTKNAFVFLPLFFGRQLMDTTCWIPCLCAFFAFCFASSGIYCLNDIHDVEADRQHKEKCKRPIASGAISKRNAYCIMLMCWAVSIAFLTLGCKNEFATIFSAHVIVLIYIIMNIAYCLRLKRYAIIDVFIIAIGFVLRIVLGGIVTHIELSQWIVLMTFLLALFIAFAKRRDDVATYETSGVKLRDNISRYNISFMNQALCILASITMVCYIMYTVSDDVVNRIGNHYLYTTSIFVLAGIIRFLQVAIVDEKSGSPTKFLIKDRFIHACILAWIITFACFLYL